ncbi:FHA domain-containing protein [Sphaerospermopsis aphanizomenoides BCCUSP55]|uniref:FHA domain-containing protein n=1 Tax=Sphaerospermopsis aphanizomenoides TaxID=459663 RepID=UPI000B2A457B|nr:FHA domain-containing protein [Sphaerospermopsis aphanizomenoides]MBK1987467.1 FHA domain-containing protein [Sphaerospermopsis aphanizomenoides BCCUSP55]
MNVLTLQWQEAGQNRTQQVYEQQPSKNPGTCRIGRDPSRCDIVLTHPTVSGLHIEIFFDSQQQRFYIRNLREPNPPQVNSQPLVKGEMPLSQGSIIYLGQQSLQVTEVSINSFPATVIVQPPVQPKHHQHKQPIPTQPNPVYGLECPKCHKVSPPENLQIGCPWCGTSLAAAVSVLIR